MSRFSYGAMVAAGQLNLLATRDITLMAEASGLERYRICSVAFLGFKSNLLFFMEKE